MVSLYLLLISFFIVLNAMSQLHPSSSALVIKSMMETFGNNPSKTSTTNKQSMQISGTTDVNTNIPVSGNSSSTLSQIIKRHLKFTDNSSTRNGKITFELYLNEFFNMTNYSVRPRKKRFIRELSENINDNIIVQCDILINQPKESYLTLLENLVFLFEYYGMKRDNIIVGVSSHRNHDDRIRCFLFEGLKYGKQSSRN